MPLHSLVTQCARAGGAVRPLLVAAMAVITLLAGPVHAVFVDSPSRQFGQFGLDCRIAASCAVQGGCLTRGRGLEATYREPSGASPPSPSTVECRG